MKFEKTKQMLAVVLAVSLAIGSISAHDVMAAESELPEEVEITEEIAVPTDEVADENLNVINEENVEELTDTDEARSQVENIPATRMATFSNAGAIFDEYEISFSVNDENVDYIDDILIENEDGEMESIWDGSSQSKTVIVIANKTYKVRIDTAAGYYLKVYPPELHEVIDHTFLVFHKDVSYEGNMIFSESRDYRLGFKDKYKVNCQIADGEAEFVSTKVDGVLVGNNIVNAEDNVTVDVKLKDIYEIADVKCLDDSGNELQTNISISHDCEKTNIYISEINTNVNVKITCKPVEEIQWDVSKPNNSFDIKFADDLSELSFSKNEEGDGYIYYVSHDSTATMSFKGYSVVSPTDGTAYDEIKKIGSVTFYDTVTNPTIVIKDMAANGGKGKKYSVKTNVTFEFNDTEPEFTVDTKGDWFNPNTTDEIVIEGQYKEEKRLFMKPWRIKKIVYSDRDLAAEATRQGISLETLLDRENEHLAQINSSNKTFKIVIDANNKPTSDTTYYIYCISRNNKNKQITKLVKADGIAPVISFKYKDAFSLTGDHATNSRKINVKVSASDVDGNGQTMSGVSKFNLYVDGKYVATEAASKDGKAEFFGVELEKNKAHEIAVKAYDKVKNVSEISKYTDEDGNEDSRPIWEDETKPILSVVPGANGVESDGVYYYRDTPQVCIIADDEASSGISRVEIIANGKKVPTANVVNENGQISHVNLDEYFSDPNNYSQHLQLTLDKNDLGEDKKFEIKAKVWDAANNENELTEFDNCVVAIDNEAPIFIGLSINGEGSQIPVTKDNKEKFFGYFCQDAASISVVANDGDGVGVDHIEYYTVPAAKDENAIKDSLSVYNASSKPMRVNGVLEDQGGVFEIKPEKGFKGYVFILVVDRLGNCDKDYSTTAGLIIEPEKRHVDDNGVIKHITLTPVTTKTKDAAKNPLYKEETYIKVDVADTYSGIEKIEWIVDASYDGEKNHKGEFAFDGNVEVIDGTIENPINTGVIIKKGDVLEANDSLIDNLSYNINEVDRNLITGATFNIPVKNNSNDIPVSVKLYDQAGNCSVEKTVVSIDMTKPTVAISFDNEDADPEYTDFYKADRKATITVTERNFNAADFVLSIKSTGNSTPKLSEWTHEMNTVDPDASTHTATLVFDTDGDYEVSASFKDMAGNVATDVFETQKFTIDKTLPVIEVGFNNNSAANGKYYSASRIATVSINEHNFDSKRVTITGTSEDDGQSLPFPAISSFSTSGDMNTASIVFEKDGVYKFTVECSDKARNAAEKVEIAEFVIDLTAPEVEINGIENMSANNDVVAPFIVLKDTNYDADKVEVSLVGSNRGTVNYDRSITVADHGQVHSFVDFVREQEVDDIYTLSATATDMAGNSTTEQIVFSVNRFGSVYTFADSTKKILETYTNKPIDIEIVETNINELSMDDLKLVVTYNGKPENIVENKDYTIAKSTNKASWSQYTYKIDKKLFNKDGAYTVTLYSVDEAGNKNQNIDESKKAAVAFGVDMTAPVIVPITIDSDEIYNSTKYLADVTINDNLVLADVNTIVNGENVEYTFDGDDYTFPIAEATTKQTVTVVATDAAGNSVTYTAKNVIVSSNAVVRLYNNRVLFVNVCAGSLTGLALAIIFFRFKRRKRQK